MIVDDQFGYFPDEIDGLQIEGKKIYLPRIR